MAKSIAEQVGELSPEEYQEFINGLTDEEVAGLAYDADFWLRPEQDPDRDGSDWRVAAFIGGRGAGKALDVNTKVPTPNGWTTMGDIKPGQKLFDENGDICTVIEVHEPYTPDKVVKLEFTDGQEIYCDYDHLWTTWTHRDRKSYNRRNDYQQMDDSVGLPNDWPTWTKTTRYGHPIDIGPKTRTTREIVDTFRHDKRGDLNHSIPVSGVWNYQKKDLKIDPYIFGYWLGDGSKNTGKICCHTSDSDNLKIQLESAGLTYRKYDYVYRESTMTVFNIHGMMVTLRKEGAGGKNIPRKYIESSKEQRISLLRGLMDSDGYYDPKRSFAEFCAMREEHANAVFEILVSLGERPTIKTGRATLNGKDYGVKYRVFWRPIINPFRMSRKADLIKPLGAQASRHKHRMIKDFEELEGRKVRCIEVDSKNKLFLVGEHGICCHNTFSSSQWIRKKAMENPGTRIAIGGRTVGDVRRINVFGDSGILAVHPEDERPEYKSNQATLYWPNGSIAELHSSEAPDAARGPQYHYTLKEELAAWKNDVDSSGATLSSNLDMATRLGDNPQTFIATTPKRTKFMRDLIDAAKDPKERIKLIHAKTTDNTMLSKSYIDSMLRQYGDSELAKQELEGQMLDDADGLVFTQEMIHKAHKALKLPSYPLRIIAVDPSVSASSDNADECGIMAMGATSEPDLTRRRAIVYEDYSITAPPDVWAQVVVEAAQKYNTKFVVVEKNQGGDLLRSVIQAKDPTLQIFLVTATKGKLKRAEPVVVLMQQQRILFDDYTPVLDDQLLFYDPSSRNSPDRMDAFVWGATALLIDPPKGLYVPHVGILNTSRRKLSTNSRGSGRSRFTSSVKRKR